jgi:hypothetical protein
LESDGETEIVMAAGIQGFVDAQAIRPGVDEHMVAD